MARTNSRVILVLIIGFGAVYFLVLGGDQWSSKTDPQVINELKESQTKSTGERRQSVTRFEAGVGAKRTLPEQLMNAAPENKQLIDHIRESWLIEPNVEGLRLANPSRRHYSQIGQSEVIDELLHEQNGGFFIECGAGNGERLSNTLFFEKHRNWTGLLIEPNPESFSKLLGKQRRSHVINACLSPEPRPMTLQLRKATLASALQDYTDSEHSIEILKSKGKFQGNVQVQCFPLYSILKALDISSVDYFSLDVEGPELPILATFPFDKIHMKTISVEYDISDKNVSQKKRYDIIGELEKNGYSLSSDLENQDLIFVKSTDSDQTT